MNENEYFDLTPQEEPQESFPPLEPMPEYIPAEPVPEYIPAEPIYEAPQMPIYEAPPVYTPPQAPKEPPKKKKKKGLSLAVIAIALCCGLLGSICGGLIVGIALQNQSGSSEPSVNVARPTESYELPEGDVSPTVPTVENLADNEFLTPAQVYANNVEAVVGISNESTSYNVFGQPTEYASSGSGFIVTSDGEILTNYHVIQGAQTLTVTLYDGSQYPATVIGYEATSDVALIKIEATGLKTTTLGNSSDLYVGAEVAAIGNPLGELTYSLNVGYISSMERSVNTDGTPINMMQIDVSINSGNSGGPLFDMKGNVVGINTAKYSGSTSSGTTIEGIGFAIPIDDVKLIINDLRTNGAVLDRAALGITASSVTSSESKRFNLPMGAYVESVTAGSAAEKAGLKVGDIIIGLDKYEIEQYEDLSSALKKYRAGDEAVLTVYRNGKTLTLDVVFDAKSVEETAATETETTEFNPWDFIFP